VIAPIVLAMAHEWKRATLGDAVRDGDPITVWCNYRDCGYRLTHGEQYRATLSVDDLAQLAERYGADTSFVDIRAKLCCRHCGSGDVSTIVDNPYETPTERWKRVGR
jgi:hypothetical protein